jgi:hypothetical protein
MHSQQSSRRLFCRDLAALGTLAVLPNAVFSKPLNRTLNLNDPEDALTAMIKMRGSLVAEDVPHWYYGTIYAVLPGESPVPMVSFEGSEIDYYERQPDGTYHAYAATASFFRDVKTRKLIDVFDNPITGKRNEVTPNTVNVDAHYIYSPNGYKRSDDPRPLSKDTTINEHLEWNESGDNIWLTMRRAYPAGLPMAEHQLIRGSLTELHDPSTNKVYTTAAPTFIAPWLRWMDMQDHPGHTVWAGPAQKLDSIADYPRELIDLMEKHFPEKLTAKPA